MTQSLNHTLVAVSIGGAISLLTTWLNNWYQLNREKEKWYREQLYEDYRQCIKFLIKSQNLSDSEKSFPTTKELFLELQERLLLLKANYPTNRSSELNEFSCDIEEYLSVFPHVHPHPVSDRLMSRLMELIKTDPRIKGKS